MQGTHLLLTKRFLAFYLVTHSKRGISAIEWRAIWACARRWAATCCCACAGRWPDWSAFKALGGTVELDDFYVGACSDGPGQGCGKQAMIAAVERGNAASGPGRLCLRAVLDCGSGAYSDFAEGHIEVMSRVVADGWAGTRAGLSGWPGLEQAPFDASDLEAALPTCHHVVSNFKAFVQGTFHGVSRTCFQGFCDEFAWRYSHRGRGGAAAALLRDCCAGHASRAELLRSTMEEQPYSPPFTASSTKRAGSTPRG